MADGSDMSGIHVTSIDGSSIELSLDEAIGIANTIHFDVEVMAEMMQKIGDGSFDKGMAGPLREWLLLKADDTDDMSSTHVSLYIRCAAAEDAIQQPWLEDIVGPVPNDQQLIGRILQAFGEAQIALADPETEGGPRLIFNEDTIRDFVHDASRVLTH